MRMKYLIALFVFVNMSLASLAQDTTGTQVPHYTQNHPADDNSSGDGHFHKENLFSGGSVTIALGSGGTVLGANPVFGYSINNWLDAGIALNFSYLSLHDYDQFGDLVETDKQTIIGPGAFIKIYPADFLFVQAQIENNYITDKVIDNQMGTSGSISYAVPAYLTGLGYCGGREGSGSLYYYISILIDLSNNLNSPYLYHTNGSSIIQPIFRAGLQIPLFQGGKNRDKYY